MASSKTCICLFTLFFTFLSPFIGITNAKFSKQIPETRADQYRVQKMSHLHFYFHDTLTGKDPSAIIIIGQRNKFGGTAIIDDPLTESVDSKSKEVGRAQGMYSFTSQDVKSLLLVMNFAFNEGIYNGSSLSILGRNPFFGSVREMPIVGGSGIFRFARGYALAKTAWFNVETGDAVVEYNVFVMHY